MHRLDEPDRLVGSGCQQGGATGLFRPTVHNLIRYHRLSGVDRHMFYRDLLLTPPSVLVQALGQRCQRPRGFVSER
jgi:hypothetical protein